MGRPRIDLTGQRFGRLVVVECIPVERGTKWLCRCDCGGSTESYGQNLKNGSAQSCGCLQRVLTRALKTRHGHSANRQSTPEYAAWSGMRQRCHNPSHKYFANYGGRGIVVCDRWRDSFEAFLDDMGPRPTQKHSIERADNDGPYSPENCRWATWLEQGANRRSTVALTAFGETAHLNEWVRRTGLSEGCIRGRLKAGWNAERALSTPSQRSK